MPRSPLQTAQHLAAAGRLTEAESACRQALRARPGDAQLLRLLGRITRDTGQTDESVRIFEQLRRARPNDIQLLGELGASLTQANQARQARPLLTQAVQRMPNAAEWHIWLGRCQLQLFDAAAAVVTMRRAIELAPDDADAALQASNALLLGSAPEQAEACARRALEIRPGWRPAMLALAAALHQETRLDEQMAVLREVLGVSPNDPAACSAMAACLRMLGRNAEAIALLEPLASHALTPTLAITLAPVYLAAARAKDARDLIERALRFEPIPAPERSSLCFALGDALRRLGRHDEAFDAYRRANEARPRSFDRARQASMHATLQAAFGEGLAGQPRATLDASRCVFIVGMPRSGTTLVEQIIGAHPRAHGAGEISTLQHALDAACAPYGGPGAEAFARLTAADLDRGAQLYLDAVDALAPGALRITDKMPHNFQVLGLIERMLPGSRVIACTRSPLDNCLSLYFTQLSLRHAYASDLADLGWAYAQHLRLMRHWREVCSIPILDVRYEEVVADLDAQARRIIEFVGLDWDDRCLRFYESDRPVTTASVDQVRKPIYTTSVARWKRYEHHLGPLIESLRAEGVEVPKGEE